VSRHKWQSRAPPGNKALGLPFSLRLRRIVQSNDSWSALALAARWEWLGRFGFVRRHGNAV